MFVVLLFFTTGCALEKETFGQYTMDTEITTKVKARIFKDSTLKSREIHVETYKGDVQLSGFVNTYVEAKKAAMIARKVTGVKSITNNIKVKRYK